MASLILGLQLLEPAGAVAPSTEYSEPELTAEKSIEELIVETFPEKPELFLAIAKAESNLNPRAYNPEAHRGCNGSYSLLQVACVHYEKRGIYGEDRFDVKINLQVAREVYDESGVRAWGAFTNQSYLKHL